MPAQDLPLAADFPVASREQWRALAAAVLAKGSGEAPAEPEAALSYETYDGIRIRPLYTAQDAPGVDAAGLPGRPPFVRAATPDAATATGWDVRARHGDGDAAQVNRAVLADLENGVTSVWLHIGTGLAADAIGAALDGVYLDLAPVVLDAGGDVLAAADALLAAAAARGVAADELRGSFGADPIGLRASEGGARLAGDVFAQLVARRDSAPHMQLATVDATVWHEAGGSDAQELGIGTAVGVAYLRALTDAGLPIDDAFAALEFRWAVGAEQFPAIAKLRAARRVWDRVAEVCGASDNRRGQRQHAVTSPAMLTRRDPWVNMLRTTIGCFAAAVGGADAITVLPFDSAIGVPDDFARRIARNTQSILHDESSLARVIDAAGGSWFVESLTDELAGKAWDVFTAVERAGGAAQALEDGFVEQLLADVRRRRADDIAHRRSPITGVSEFAFVAEAPVERAPRPDTAGYGLVPRVRYAEEYENLRDAADAASVRPTVFLAGLGSPAAVSARAGFASTLFHAGGIECVTATGTVEDVVGVFAESGTAVACLCSSDAGYAADGAAAAQALRRAGARQVWVAGRADVPGTDGRLYAGCDAPAVLRAVFDAWGISVPGAVAAPGVGR